MTDDSRPVLQPGPDHPITITPTSQRVRITVNGQVVADSTAALSLQEADYPAVLYLPRADVDQSLIERTEHQTYCPYKGDASYYSIPAGGERSVNAIWTYESPYEPVAQIKDYVAFYPDRVDEVSVS